MGQKETKTTTQLKVVDKQKRNNRHFINIVVILVITFGYTIYSLWGDLPQVMDVFTREQGADYRILAIIVFLIAMRFFIDGVILFFFARLYTPHYKLHRGVANGLVGRFYSDITPNSSGGQFFQVKTFSKQGIPVSISASILVMYFILYQSVSLLMGTAAIFINLEQLATMQPVILFGLQIPVWVFSLLGFIINAVAIIGIFLVAHSKKTHDFLINKGVAIGAKVRLVKDPQKTKAKLHITFENFRVELRRLYANIPATILLVILFFVKFLVDFSFTYFIAIMLDPTLIGTLDYISTVSKSSFLLMITNIVPIPGAAGFAEYFFELMFHGSFVNKDLHFTKAVQIVWRATLFYTGLLVGGLVTAFYRSSMEEFVDEDGNVKTFIDVQSDTYEERKASSDTAFLTSQLSISQIAKKLNPKKGKDK